MADDAALSPGDRLVLACYNGDLLSAAAAIAEGASVNEPGKAPRWHGTVLPLAAVVRRRLHDVAVWLLSHGADPNGDEVMFHGAYRSTAAILQLLIDAGGDVNRLSGSRPPLFWAVWCGNRKDKVRVLLAQPSLDLTINLYAGKTLEQHARARGKPALADTIAQEVSGRGFSFCWGSGCADGVWWCCCGSQIARRPTLVRPLVQLIAHVLWCGHGEACCGCGVVGSR